MEEKSPGLTLMEPASPEALIPHTGLWPWFAGAAVLTLAVVLVIWLVRRSRRTVFDPHALRIAAHEEAAAALGGIEAEDARDAAVRCSLVLRRYLATAARDPSLYETHEEFVSRKEALRILHPEARAAASEGFAILAALKYGPLQPQTEASKVIGDSRQLLETLHGGFPA